MSKRGADDQLTKDIFEQGGFGPTGTANPVSKASESAMSARKIAQPRGRLSRGPGASRPRPSPAPTSNPFGNVNGVQQPLQQTFGAVNGFTFGGSTGQDSAFNFQSPSSSSFTFGPPAQTPNPFANANGNAEPTQDPDVMMDSPQKKQNTGSVFGSMTPNTSFSFGQSQQSAAPTFGFGSTTSNANSAGSGNIFGRVSTQEPKGDTPSQSTAPAFSFTAPSTSKPNFAANGNLFGRVSTPEPKDDTPTQSSTPAFSFAASSTPKPNSASDGGLFGRVSTPEPKDDTPSQSSAPIVGFGSTTSNTNPAGSGNMFGRVSTPEPKGDTPSQSTAPTFSFTAPSTSKPNFATNGNLFGRVSTPEPKDDTPTQSSTPAFSFAASSTPKPNTASSGGPFNRVSTPEPKEDAPSQPSASKFTFGSSQPLPRSPAPQQTASSDLVASTPAVVLKAAPSEPAEITPAAIAPEKPAPQSAQGGAPKLRPRSNAPPFTNSTFNPEDFLQNDKTYRLRSLDREFIKRIKAMDCHVHDLAPTVLFYIKVRDNIGKPIGGLYTRVEAGMKRKADGPTDQPEENMSQAKKARAEPITTTEDVQPSQTVPSPAKASATSNTSSTPNTMSAHVSKTSDLFSSYISTPSVDTGGKLSTAPASAPPTNVFANVKPSSTSFSGNPFAGLAGSTKSTQDKLKPLESSSSNTQAFITPNNIPPKQPAFEIPKFAVAATGFSDFGAKANKSVEAERKKRKQEEYDSEEETEDAYEERVRQKQKEFNARLEQVPRRGFVPSVPSVDISPSSPFERDSSTSGEEQDEEADEEPIGSPSSGSRDESPILEDAPNNSFKGFPVGSNIFQSTPKAPVPSPFTPINGTESMKKPFQPSKNFNFTPSATTSSQSQSTSVLFGAQPKAGPIPGEGLFGSRPSTPNPEDNTPALNNLFGNVGKVTGPGAQSDHTWKAGTPIKFGTPDKPDNGPVLNITAATPPAKDTNVTPGAFSGLFGMNKSAPNSEAKPPSNLGFGFSPAPGFLGAASHLAPSAVGSPYTSRDNSPGLTDNESIHTNGGDTEDEQTDPQASLMQSRPGEENEEILFEARAKGMKYYSKEAADAAKSNVKPNEYNSIGVGEMRVLRNKDNGKTRIVLRTEPSSNVALNTNLVTSHNYVSDEGKTGSVRFPIFTDKGMEKWALKVKSKGIADELIGILNANKVA